MAQDGIDYAYTFDDLLLLPGPSPVLPSEVDLSTPLTRRMRLAPWSHEPCFFFFFFFVAREMAVSPQ